jgi:hypothetical protein
MTTELASVREAARRLGVKEGCPGPSHTRGRPRTVRRKPGKVARAGWSWEGTTTAAQEEARKEANIELLQALVEDSRRGVQVRVFLARWESLW